MPRLSQLLTFRESFLEIAATLRLLQAVPGLQHGTGGGKHKPLSPSKSQGFSFAPSLACVRSPAMSGANALLASIIAESEQSCLPWEIQQDTQLAGLLVVTT